MNILGISLASASLLLFSQAKDAEEIPSDLEEGKAEVAHADTIDSRESIARQCEVPKRLRWFLGFVMALVAGTLFGYTFDPAIELAHRPGRSKDQLDYVWSNFAGILLTGNIVFIFYVMIRGEKSFIRKSVVLPAVASGAIWAVAQLAWFKANEELSMAVAFPIVASIPGIVAMLLGICVFGELQTKRARTFACLGVLVRLPGIVLIALSGA